MRLDLIASCSFSLFYLLFSLSFFRLSQHSKKKKKEKKEHIVEQTLNENVPLSCFSISFPLYPLYLYLVPFPLYLFRLSCQCILIRSNFISSDNECFRFSSVSCSLLIVIKYIKKYRATSLRINRTKLYIYSMFGEAKYYVLLILFFIYFIFSVYSRTLSCFLSSLLRFHRRNRRDLRVKKSLFKRLTCCARHTNNRDENLS